MAVLKILVSIVFLLVLAGIGKPSTSFANTNNSLFVLARKNLLSVSRRSSSGGNTVLALPEDTVPVEPVTSGLNLGVKNWPSLLQNLQHS